MGKVVGFGIPVWQAYTQTVISIFEHGKIIISMV